MQLHAFVGRMEHLCGMSSLCLASMWTNDFGRSLRTCDLVFDVRLHFWCTCPFSKPFLLFCGFFRTLVFDFDVAKWIFSAWNLLYPFSGPSLLPHRPVFLRMPAACSSPLPTPSFPHNGELQQRCAAAPSPSMIWESSEHTHKHVARCTKG